MNPSPIFKGKIRNKLVITFVLFVSVVVGGSGWFLYYSTKRGLEEELGSKLIAIARVAADQINADLVTRLGPGDEGSRTYANFMAKLEAIRQATGAKKIYVFNRQNLSLIDTDRSIPIGWEYVKLRFEVSELDAVWSGRPSHSVLFRGSDGEFYKTGFAPIRDKGDNIVAAVGVDASATFMKAVQDFRRNVVLFSMVGVLFTITIGFLLAKTITDPIKALVKSATRIGQGDLETAVSIGSGDELGYLGRMLDQMRRGLIERDNRLKTMLASIAHEIRNPLGGIEIFAGLIADELEDGSRGREHIEKIGKEVKNLNRIITEFLEFARPSEPKKEPVLVTNLIDDVVFLLSPELESNKIWLRKRFSQDGICAYVDPEQMKRALLNIFKNSIQAMSRGGTLDVKGRGAGTTVVLEVSDTGIGIPPDDLERLFDPFFTTKERGVGLGLSIVKKIIEENGGEISVSSKVDEGTSFTIRLPAFERGISDEQDPGN
ncbi:MAG TPA: HAMP domain-containing protein [Candidatus Latescibacteria bacterium]|nr:HAMP domain-containing protein [Candidatus Latescibacterota bacterium]